MRVLQKINFKVPSDLKSLDQLLVDFDRVDLSGIPKKVCLECQLALAEGFTNAVRHAHKALPKEKSIEIEIEIFSQSLELRIFDYGPPFDLEACIQYYCQGKDNNSGGGRGVVILHKIADQLRYFRTSDNRNCLSIVKNYSSEEPNSVP